MINDMDFPMKVSDSYRKSQPLTLREDFHCCGIFPYVCGLIKQRGCMEGRAKMFALATHLLSSKEASLKPGLIV